MVVCTISIGVFSHADLRLQTILHENSNIWVWHGVCKALGNRRKGPAVFRETFNDLVQLRFAQRRFVRRRAGVRRPRIVRCAAGGAGRLMRRPLLSL